MGFEPVSVQTQMPGLLRAPGPSPPICFALPDWLFSYLLNKDGSCLILKTHDYRKNNK